MTFRRPTPLFLLALAAGALTLGACSDEDPPGWLEDLAADTATTTTVAPPPTSVPPTTVAGSDDADTAVLELAKGNCLVEAPFTEGQPVEVVSVATVHCAEAHQAEVYAVVQLPQARSEPFPGGRLAAEARDQCLERFEAFVGLPWTSSELEFVALRPTEQSWREGDRAILCVVFRPDGADLEGSVRGEAY
jgi:hypothetical protein